MVEASLEGVEPCPGGGEGSEAMIKRGDIGGIYRKEGKGREKKKSG